MKKARLVAILSIVVIALVITPIFTGCGKVAEYADPITENILVSMNNSDYSGFSKDFDGSLKNELPEAAFPGLIEAVNGAIGNYITGSKKITGVSIENGQTTATYEADFEGLEDITVEIVFTEINDEMKVIGLWFN